MKPMALIVLSITVAFAFLGGFGSRGALARQSPAEGQSVEKLPPDIHPESLSRMPRTKRDELATDEEKAAFDRVAAMSPTVAATKGVLGPTGTRAQIPELAESYRNMFNMLTKKCGVEQKYFELAVLVATRESNNEVEWNDHEPNGIKLLGPEVVEMIRNKQDPKGLEEKEALTIQYGREVFHQPRVSSKTFADMERNFGRKGTLGIALIVGYYTANAMLMHTYDQHTDPNRKRPFADVVAMDAKNH